MKDEASPFFRAGAPQAGMSDRAEEAAVEAASFILALRAKGIHDTSVLRAMELVPREIFAPRRFTDLSRTDVSLPLPCGQTMTAPGTVATMLVALGVKQGQRILEVGTGTGYVTALLARLGAEVMSVERFATLAQAASEHLKIVDAGEAARVESGDGLAARRGRFDRILLNGATAAIPETLTDLLGPAGRLVGAISVAGLPRLLRLDREAGGELRQEVGPPLRLSPLVAGAAATL